MGIQQRLLKQRYSSMNLRTPTKEELNESGLVNIRFKKVIPTDLRKIKQILLYPPKRDKYFQGYITLIEDFFAEVSKTSSQGKIPRVMSELYNQQLLRKLSYFIQFPQQFGNSFDHYCITWMFNLMMSMRSYIMRQRIERGELPPIWNKCLPSTHGYYKLPKPMDNQAMMALAYQIYDVVYEDSVRYLSKV